MILPTIHDNGTSAQSLAASAEAAYDALQVAYDLLRQTAPNMRDFYFQPPLSFEHAVSEHKARQHHLVAVMSELKDLIIHLDRAK